MTLDRISWHCSVPVIEKNCQSFFRDLKNIRFSSPNYKCNNSMALALTKRGGEHPNLTTPVPLAMDVSHISQQ